MITRTRSERVPAEQETVIFNCISSADHGDPPHTPKSYTFTWPEYFRNEEKTRDWGGGRHDWNHFCHYRSDMGEPMSTLLPVYTEKWAGWPHILKGYVKNVQAGYHTYGYGSELEPYGPPGAPNNGLPSWKSELADGYFVPPPSNLEELQTASLRMMMPGIKAELSLINSVIELKDFRTLLKLTQSMGERLQNLLPVARSWLKLASNAPRACLRELVRKAGGNYLQWKFAFEPLLSDISAIHRAVSRTERRMNDLVTRMGRWNVRHYTLTFSEYPNVDETYPDKAYIWHPLMLMSTGLYGCRRRVSYEPTTFHAEIEYSYYFTRYQLEHARALSFLDALGVNPNPAIIWNAIPWSFLVDWVVAVGPWLDSMKTSNMEPMINIRRYLWSVKRARSIYIDRGIDQSYYGLPPEQRAPMPVVRETAYRRTPGLPGWSSFQASGITPQRVMLGASLASVRRWKRS